MKTTLILAAVLAAAYAAPAMSDDFEKAADANVKKAVKEITVQKQEGAKMVAEAKAEAEAELVRENHGRGGDHGRGPAPRPGPGRGREGNHGRPRDGYRHGDHRWRWGRMPRGGWNRPGAHFLGYTYDLFECQDLGAQEHFNWVHWDMPSGDCWGWY